MGPGQEAERAGRGAGQGAPPRRSDRPVLEADAAQEAARALPAAAPALLLPPALLGAAEVGGEVAVDPGRWSGVPAPSLAFQWRRDGADIPGATARAYAPTPGDDGRALACLVTATSPAGTAAATAGPRRAACRPPRALAALPEEVFDAGDGAERVETAFAFEGANLAFALAAAPPGVAIDPADGALRLPLDRPVAGGRVTVAASNSGGTAFAELLYTVEAAPDEAGPPPNALPYAPPPAPPAAAIAEAMAFPLLAYDEAAFGSGANSRPKTVHNLAVVALAAHAGSPLRAGGRTAALYLLDQFVAWTGSKLPWAQGGVSGQRDFPFLCAAALARRTPAVWDRLTPLQRAKTDRVVEGLLVSFAWQMSDANPFVTGALPGPERTIRGGEWGRGRVPNFTFPATLGPLVAADCLGGPAPAQAFLDGFDRAAFAAAVAAADVEPAGCLAALRETFGRDWEGDGRRAGPTAAELEAAVRNFAFGGLTLAEPTAVAARALGRMWSARIRPGVELGPDARVPKGYARPPAGAVGIFEPATIPGAPNRAPGRDAQVGRIPDLADWVHWEAAGLADREGGAFELFARDGGAPGTGSGPGPRSAMTYAHEGASVAVTGLAALAACGLIDRTDPDLRAALVRQDRGIADLKLRNRYGHRSFAKAGRPWTGRGTNEDWDGALVEQWKLGLIYDLWTEVLKPWVG